MMVLYSERRWLAAFIFEKSHKRVEDAARYLKKILALGLSADYLDDEILGKEAHTVVSTILEIGDLIRAL